MEGRERSPKTLHRLSLGVPCVLADQVERREVWADWAGGSKKGQIWSRTRTTRYRTLNTASRCSGSLSG